MPRATERAGKTARRSATQFLTCEPDQPPGVAPAIAREPDDSVPITLRNLALRFGRARRAEENRCWSVLGHRVDNRHECGKDVASGEVVFVEHRGSEAGLRENHHAESGLQESLA